MTARCTNVCIPYRAMPECLSVAVPRVRDSLHRLGPHNLIIVEPLPGRRFNLGKTLNVGFALFRSGAVESYPAYSPSDLFLFQPVDCIPHDYAELRHDPDVDFKGFTCNEPDFYKSCWFVNAAYEDVNGFTNEFWGWGDEDNEMFLRLDIRGVKRRLVPASFDMINDASPDFVAGRSGHDPLVQELARSRDVHASGLNTLQYEVVEVRRTGGVPHYLVSMDA